MIYNAARDRRLSTKFQVDTYKTMRQGSGGLCTKFQVNTSKSKNFHFGGALGDRGLDCGQYQILTDRRNGLKNPNMNFGSDRSHRLGGV